MKRTRRRQPDSRAELDTLSDQDIAKIEKFLRHMTFRAECGHVQRILVDPALE
jgi:cytochrome c553